MKVKDKIEGICKSYVDLELECDGMSRVLSYVLEEEGGLKYGRDYVMRSGVVKSNFGDIDLHFWIEISKELGGGIVDYRLRMWFGDKEEIPHGVFDPEKCRDLKYYPMRVFLENTHKVVFNVLTENWSDYDED